MIVVGKFIFVTSPAKRDNPVCTTISGKTSVVVTLSADESVQSVACTNLNKLYAPVILVASG